MPIIPNRVLAPFLLLTLLPCVGGAAEPDESGEKTAWKNLFDGKTLGGWEVIEKYDFKKHGRVRVEKGRVLLEKGSPATGMRWKGKFPTVNYEVALEGMRVDGQDFFCGMTFPVGDDALTLVLGGWGGEVVGLSSIDGEPAVENQTCQYVEFEQKKWYRIRLRVTEKNVSAWIDDRKIIDLAREEHQFSIYWEVDPCLPFGIATWHTTGALRNIRVKAVEQRK
ncbi:MAG: DUF1080 domain-containing protein [Planctomycetes bacterium]|nr:DUF1080 domain-containing protein [Planctomycetota bacterium]